MVQHEFRVKSDAEVAHDAVRLDDFRSDEQSKLLVVGTQVMFNAMSLNDLYNLFCVGYEFKRFKDRTLRYATVNSNSSS